MNIQPSEYLGGLRDEMRLFIRMQKRPTVNELEGMVTRLNTGIALTAELEEELCLRNKARRLSPRFTLISNGDDNGGDAA
ncbi:hypothetical protein [Martelella endophytica]|uniref:Uncharacterized protein n=1 Tax=Martelella endophytica TaxID=1486262 RepID=A0A0D5LQL3_MAREN|nr:hypothetical protein [Martelella endophytica]AJY46499.1 hypothetical protein TM49_13740 [Martelella endophytica]